MPEIIIMETRNKTIVQNDNVFDGHEKTHFGWRRDHSVKNTKPMCAASNDIVPSLEQKEVRTLFYRVNGRTCFSH